MHDRYFPSAITIDHVLVHFFKLSFIFFSSFLPKELTFVIEIVSNEEAATWIAVGISEQHLRFLLARVRMMPSIGRAAVHRSFIDASATAVVEEARVEMFDLLAFEVDEPLDLGSEDVARVDGIIADQHRHRVEGVVGVAERKQTSA